MYTRPLIILMKPLGLILQEVVYLISKYIGISIINVGGNLFGILGRSIKRAIPFIKSLILPELGNFTKNFTEDISQNIPPKQSIKSNLKKSVKNVGKKILRGGGGGKVKRKVGSKKNGKRVNNGKLLENHKKYVKRGAEGKCDFMEDDIFSSEKYV